MAEMTHAGSVDRAHDHALTVWEDLVVALRDPELGAAVKAAGESILEALQAGSKVIFLGNGGSAAEASHLAAELVGRCTHDRQPLPAIALNDVSIITAVGNDYGFDAVFARGVRALGTPGDILVAMSTSGASRNVTEAMKAAHEVGMTTIAMTGRRGQRLAGAADHGLIVPATETSRVQEVHLMWGHAWCEAVDAHWAAQEAASGAERGPG